MNKVYLGDNLLTLQKLPDNSVDAIITDPPYLTGNAKLTYKDNKKEDEWIAFMKERLIECKRVMKDTATLLIHIDENMHIELANLCYEVFGKKNHITTFIWKKKSSSSAQSKFATVEHEYIIAVAKNIKKCKWNGVPQFEPDVKNHFHDYELTTDGYGEYRRETWKLGSDSVANNGDNKYPIYHGADPNDRLETYEASRGSTPERTVGKGKNQTYPLYIDDGTQLAQRFDKTSKTERNPETRPNAVYPIHYGQEDGYGKFALSEYNQHGASREKGNENNKYKLHATKTKISLTPFPGSIEVKPMNGKELGCWRAIPATCQKLIDADMLVVKNGKIYQKQYAHFQFNKKTGKLEPFVRTTPIRTILQGDKFPTNLRSNKEIKEIFGKTAFTYSKPLELVKNLLKIVSNEGDVVLDIFAGSGTTGQAAFELKRKFILCQLDEGGIPDLLKKRLDKTIGAVNYQIEPRP